MVFVPLLWNYFDRIGAHVKTKTFAEMIGNKEYSAKNSDLVLFFEWTGCIFSFIMLIYIMQAS